MIWDDGIYQTPASRAAATSGVTDLVEVARGAGIGASHWVRDETHFAKLLDRRFGDGGPVLLTVKIDDTPGKGRRCATRR